MGPSIGPVSDHDDADEEDLGGKGDEARRDGLHETHGVLLCFAEAVSLPKRS